MKEELSNLAEAGADFVKELDSEVLLFSHYDCDGISSAVIAQEMLEREGVPFKQVFLDELTEEKLKEVIEGNEQDKVVFTDIGSGQVEAIREVLPERDVLVMDHHEVEEEDYLDAHVNPHLVDIDGGEKISGAGITYLVAEHLDDENYDLLPYALIGATGDRQRDDEDYLGHNEELVDKAREKGHIKVKKGLKLFGRKGKKIVKALEYTTDPFLKGITNNESGAVQLLRSTGIDLKDKNGEWRSLADLSFEEEKKIVHELITRGYGDIEKIIGDVYILDNGWEIREFSSVLNACGRLEEPESGVEICRNGNLERAFRMKKRYSRKIGKYLSYLEENLSNPEVVRDLEFGTAITAGDKIHANMIGTVASIAKGNNMVEGPVIIGLAEKEENHLKISGRVDSELVEEGFKMNSFLEEACDKHGGKGGGHKSAAGGKIPKNEQERFIKFIERSLKETVTRLKDGKQ
ncbi:MAG: DHH family phosphoesterase [Candidatus Nanohaloarchaeota archaeon QJJ-9]|nr:DHH family phosphoesterase [Candidatus Nanohaloarchaeota archaeon QJJ-9]